MLKWQLVLDETRSQRLWNGLQPLLKHIYMDLLNWLLVCNVVSFTVSFFLTCVWRWIVLSDDESYCLTMNRIVWQWIVLSDDEWYCMTMNGIVWRWIVLSDDESYCMTINRLVWRRIVLSDDESYCLTTNRIVWRWIVLLEDESYCLTMNCIVCHDQPYCLTMNRIVWRWISSCIIDVPKPVWKVFKMTGRSVSIQLQWTSRFWHP